jgi:hypothetical protein
MSISWREVLFSSGDIFLPKELVDKLSKLLYKYPNDEKKYFFYIQGWTFIHFINGIIFGYLYLYLNYNKNNYIIILFILHTMWETWQAFIGMGKPWNLTGRNNIVDFVMDTSVFLLGSVIVRNLL